MASLGSPCYHQTAINFFKILLKSCLQRLRIPRKFTRKYGFNLSNPVFLNPPDGQIWTIYWTKHDGQIWFQNGWKEFVRYYSLDEGHLMLFKYQETSHFDVLLFDLSTLEMEYPVHCPHDEKTNLDDQFTDDSVEILDEKPSQWKTRLKSPLLSPRPQKKLRSGTNGGDERSFNLKNVHLNVQTEGRQSQGTKLEKSINGNAYEKSAKKKMEEEKGERIFTKKYPNSQQKTRIGPLTATEKIGALKRTSTLTSENPTFKIAMQSSYADKYSLNIPAQFAEEHIKNKQGTLILEISDGRTWSAKYNVPKINAGWKKFASDNNLKVDDVCVFELTKSDELSFKVLIFRAAEDPSYSFSQAHGSRADKVKLERRTPSNLACDAKGLSQNKKGNISISTSSKSLKPEVPRRMEINKKNIALERTKSFKSQNPYFKVTMTKSYVSGRTNLHVPLEFAKKYFNVEKNTRLVITIQRVDGRLWSVRYNSRISEERKLPEFSCGWRQFLVDNDLKIGDVCVFELIHRIKLTFVVTIFQGTQHRDNSKYPAQGSGVNGAKPERIPDIQTKDVCPSKIKSETAYLCDQIRSQVSHYPLRKAKVESSGKFSQITLLTRPGAIRALEEGEKFNSKNPFFKVTISPNHMSLTSKPTVPNKFLRMHMKNREQNMMILQVGQRRFQVKLLRHHKSSRKLSAGWPSFAKENNLQAGDVCAFELINRADVVLKVHIFRCHS